MEAAGINGNGKRESVRSWSLVLGLAVGFLLWGLFIFFAVGDKGAPPWNFGVVEDIPGQSPYSTHSSREYPGIGSHPLEETGVEPQHVMGPTPAVDILGKEVKP